MASSSCQKTNEDIDVMDENIDDDMPDRFSMYFEANEFKTTQ